MTELTTLRDKDSREAARVLAALSSSLLPEPGIAETSSHSALDSGVLKSVLAEIRQRLRVSKDDFSINTQSKIYAFVSREISKAALANTSEKNVKDRLGNKGELRPSQYQVLMGEENTRAVIEALGNKKSHVIEAVTHPDEFVHLQASYTSEDEDIRPTISIKSVIGKRAEDDFILLVISKREGQIQQVGPVFRIYHSEVDLRDIRQPFDILRAFVREYGLTFQIGSVVSKFIENEVIGVSRSLFNSSFSAPKALKPIEGTKGTYYVPFIAGAETHVQAPHSEEATMRVLFAFVVDISKYATTMRRHKVQLTPSEHWRFPTI
ncbi:MAG TPA: hypothetical protein VKB02_12840 [Pyrinomonadaceae bacterium]|nr:hypothetical protein [Pyrinomonadaceae bacterium]